jgi:hypothetical protein
VKRKVPVYKAHRRSLVLAAISSAIIMSFGAIGATSSSDDVPLPTGFRNWLLVYSTIVSQDHPLFSQLGGMHLVHVNAKGLQTLKEGGPFPYPDGTIFADDVHHFVLENGRYVEDTKKAVTVMVKDSKKYATTGGWGFQMWAEGDPSKPLVPDAAHAVEACFACHMPQKSQDYTFSTYKP